MTYKKYLYQLECRLQELRSEYRKTPTSKIEKEGKRIKKEIKNIKKMGEINWMRERLKKYGAGLEKINYKKIFT